ncbi:MAG: SDR family NAD(P)-dependent oxidoreductase [Mycobacterium sp.]|uniref:SDR family NAD(P)-dependent oxidoreductase n=1 Tax=Mycobacterium sp. TaxID=1785 RepID=UPI003F9EA7BA
MVPTSGRAVLITGANTGLGKDLARRLAVQDSFDRIYLACRNDVKGLAAMNDLQTITGKHLFEVIVMDMSDLGSVRSAIPAIDQPLAALVMNAGGTGGPRPMALTRDGVTQIFASNVLGHVVLLEELVAAERLDGVAVLTGSEAARGVPKLRIPRPRFATHSVEEFVSVIDGSFFGDRKASAMLAYAQVKYLGALWIAALARKQPERRFITMSPGNTSGTEAMRDLPTPMRIFFQHVLMPYLAPALGIGHGLEDGSARLADAVTDPSLRSGVFYASAEKALTGPVLDQSEILADFADPTIQDHADEAIHRFVMSSIR